MVVMGVGLVVGVFVVGVCGWVILWLIVVVLLLFGVFELFVVGVLMFLI